MKLTKPCYHDKVVPEPIVHVTAQWVLHVRFKLRSLVPICLSAFSANTTTVPESLFPFPFYCPGFGLSPFLFFLLASLPSASFPSSGLSLSFARFFSSSYARDSVVSQDKYFFPDPLPKAGCSLRFFYVAVGGVGFSFS